jgi:NADH dehydrogenase
MVENAEHSSALVAKNIVADIKKEPLKPYKPAFHGAMVCIGGKYGVAQVGTPKKQFVYSGFIAMLIKHMINMVYFLQVAGFNKVWTYMMHEFFHVDDKRSFLGGHFSKRSPNFWLVPLRLFVGLKWLFEGLDKLPKILEDPNYIFLIPSKLPVSGASEVVEEVVEKIVWTSGLPLPKFIDHSVSWAMNILHGASLPVPEFVKSMVDSSMDLIFYTPTGEFTMMATVFQTIMVLAELAVGAALIVGLFTALASIGSIVMGLMIWSSSMAPVEMLWYLAGACALIGGSGSTFGLDYYVLPFLKKRWKKLKFVKKWYLFT